MEFSGSKMKKFIEFLEIELSSLTLYSNFRRKLSELKKKQKKKHYEFFLIFQEIELSNVKLKKL